MTHAGEQAGKGFDGGGRILSRDLFMHFLDYEVKRSRRYQNFFCILVMRLCPVANRGNGIHQGACLQKLTRLLKEELRESDILGSLDDTCFGAILPYGDGAAGDIAKARCEGSLQYYDFRNEGYEVKIEQVCFPNDGTDTTQIVRRVASMGKP